MRLAWWPPLLLLAIASTSCVRQGAFNCTDNSQCTLAGTQGRCESAGLCSFPDTACAGGFRFGEQSGAASNECVPFDGFVTVGGTVSGLAGTGLVLQNNGADDLFVIADGPFSFATRVAADTPYAVTVLFEPQAQTCKLANATGTTGDTNVTDITVTCVSDPGILCGAVFCDPADSQVCCIRSGVPECSTSCVGAGNRPIRCDDQQDCATAGNPNAVCCGSLNGGMVQNTFCSSNTTCQAPANAYFCDPMVATPCPDGGVCTATDDPFPGYFRCF